MAKKNTLVRNASILMVASVISRIIGLIYRRPLGKVLGSVGLGYYGYASNLYSILLLISSYSIPMAVSKIVSERLATKQYMNAHKVFRCALLYAVIIGGITALITFFLGGYLLPANQQNALPALRVLAPTIFLSAILGVFRGYFQAHRTMTPTSISQIAEQIVNAIVSILAAYIMISAFAPGGGVGAYIFGAVGGTMGTASGVIAGLAFMLFVFFLNRGFFRRRMAKDRYGETETTGDIFKVILLMVTPVILTTFINNASMYLDSYLYSSIQGFHGIDADAISAAYGEFSNYYIPLINVPMALASASAAALMPEVSGRYALNDYSGTNNAIRQSTRFTMFICMPCMLGMTFLARPFMQLLFPASSETASNLLMAGSLYIFFTAMTTISGCVLQSVGKQRTAMINAAIALGLNILTLAIMLFAAPQLDIYAVMIANILFSVFYWILNNISIRKYLGYRHEIVRGYLLPLAASGIACGGAWAVYELLARLTRRPSIAIIIAVLLAIVVYLIIYPMITRTQEEELVTFPLGRKWAAVLRKLRIYR